MNGSTGLPAISTFMDMRIWVSCSGRLAGKLPGPRLDFMGTPRRRRFSSLNPRPAHRHEVHVERDVRLLGDDGLFYEAAQLLGNRGEGRIAVVPDYSRLEPALAQLFRRNGQAKPPSEDPREDDFKPRGVPIDEPTRLQAP